MNQLLQLLDEIYNGDTQRAILIRYALLTFDVLIIALFVVTTFLPPSTWITIADFAIAAILSLEFLARLLIAGDRLHFLVRPAAVTDIIVIFSLLAPSLTESFAFLRVIRTLRLLRSYHMLHQLRIRFRFFARNEEVIFNVINLVVFIFEVTALVYVLQVRANPAIRNYVDALYFTISTLTTTGFGDITLVGGAGRVLAIVIMIVGISLFLRLVQSIFRPQKVRFECTACGLNHHDSDAVHCKHCGALLHTFPTSNG